MLVNDLPDLSHLVLMCIWLGARLLIVLVNDLTCLSHMIMMMCMRLGLRLLIMLVNDLPETNRNEEIPADIVNSLHDIIQNTSAGSSVEGLRLQVEEISQ